MQIVVLFLLLPLASAGPSADPSCTDASNVPSAGYKCVGNDEVFCEEIRTQSCTSCKHSTESKAYVEQFRTTCTVEASDGSKCNPDNSRCNTADEVCGSEWALGDMDPCDLGGSLAASYKSWKNIMDSETLTHNGLIVVGTDQLWVDDLFDNKMYNATDKTDPMPNNLKVIQDSMNYVSFTCERNLPGCVDDEADTAACIQSCEQISTIFAEFENACHDSVDIHNNNAQDLYPEPLGYTCGSLKEGCISPWCTLSEGAANGLGWTRECKYLCEEYQQNLEASLGTQIKGSSFLLLFTTMVLLLGYVA